MNKSNVNEHFIKFSLVSDGEEGFNIEVQSGLPTDSKVAMVFMGMLSQINTGECSNIMLDNIYIESRIEHNEIFEEISTNWRREIEERQEAAEKSSHSIVNPLKVFGASNL